MSRRIVLFALLLTTPLSSGRDKGETWLQVTSPHFVVVTNASEKQGRRVADQFERMRSVFHVAFPKLQIDPGAPIIVLAVKDEKTFKALEPEAYLAKGSLKLGGLFLRAADKNYVLMRLDAQGDHPYSVIYHEYTHLLMSKAEWMPLWQNEGLAEFYQNTDIQEKDAELGKPSTENILWLRQNRLLPLPVLFAVDHNSPYYHEENKGSIFYAESWALTHYITINDFKQKTHRLIDYSALLLQKVDPVTAATRAFGDLQHLQSELEGYIQSGAFSYFKMTTTTEVDDSAFKVQPLTDNQSDALRADFLAYNRRTADAQALLDHVLQQDPNNVTAHETKGFIEFQQGHLEEAKKWYAQAVQLDSQSYLAHYYFAMITMRGTDDAQEREQVEKSLRSAVKLNPHFAPSFNALALFLAMQHKNLEEARTMLLTAVDLEPTNIEYRVNIANLLMMMDKSESAIQVLQAAAKLAKTPQESQTVDAMLTRIQEYTERKAQFANSSQSNGAGDTDEPDTVTVGDSTGARTSDPKIPRLKRRDFVPKGPHQFLVGILTNVHCDNPALELTVTAKGKQLQLHVDNYLKLSFTALGFEPTKDLNPCSDLENRQAKVEYVESANPAVNGQLISVELHK